MSSKKVNLANTAFTDGGYTEKLTYDANGNIETLKRTNQNGDLFDNLDHQYHFGSNRLLYVDELVSGGINGTLDDITDQGQGNYDYDAIGQLTKDKAEKITNLEWTVTNKVKSVEYDLDNDLAVDKHIDFVYDPMGQRIAKKEYGATGQLVDITYYYSDAQGNPMSVYTWKEESGNDNLYLTERNMFGAKRVGMENVGKIIASSNTFISEISYLSGDKFFELGNHLGNVLNVITDRKLPNDGNGDLLVNNFTADVVSYSDYYPFGLQIKSRNGNDESYRYGFQGQEKDDEIKGEGNSLNYEYRMHDPRIGRFFAVDPLTAKYPYWSPYQFSGNRVIDAIELEGLELKTVKLILATHANGDIYIKSANVLKIVDDYTIDVKVNGKVVPGSETQIIYSYEGEDKTSLISRYEPKDYGDVDKRFRGIFSSAKYDYDDAESMKQKAKDDAKWIASFNADPVQALLVLQERDNNAPDAVYENQGLNDILDAVPALAGTQWLFIGKIKLTRDSFHRDIKPRVLNAADKTKYQKVVGKNPDIKVGKNNKIELTGTGDLVVYQQC